MMRQNPVVIVRIARDPFARSETVRIVERDPGALRRGCTWCGNLNGRGHLFRYGTDPDRVSPRAIFWGKPFCSIECMRTYASCARRADAYSAVSQWGR